MKVETALFGSLDIADEQILTFEQGLPGFEQYTRFTLIDIEETPFTYLQSVEEGELAFLLTDPFLFFPEYEFDLPESATTSLQVDSIEHLSVRAIVSVRDSLENATMNLVAPIVINVTTRQGQQVVLPRTTYTTKHPLLRPPVDTQEEKPVVEKGR